ncbi:MAG: hypothetical protein IJ785_03295 [Bacteroidales bacterium]|nr:hypothetical protein [Bacteroidales bacterium]
MKKNIKFFISAIAAVMTIGSIALVSCNKENETKDKMTDFIERKEDLLSNQFVVAQNQSNIMLCEGDTIPLLFDKNDFLIALENHVANLTQGNWVAEDVSVSLYRLNENTVQPALHISLYNTTEETGKNIYFFLTEEAISEDTTGYLFVANSNRSVSCTSTNCESGCDPILNESTKMYDCSSCKPRPYTYSTCTKSSIITIEKTAVCLALNDVL